MQLEVYDKMRLHIIKYEKCSLLKNKYNLLGVYTKFHA